MRYVDDFVCRERNGERLYSLSDPNWNVVALCDDEGIVKERFNYDAFGRVHGLTSDWDRTFTGQVLDHETGLMLYRMRFYHTGLGRFVQRDPLSYKANDVSLFRYIFNYTTNNFDPNGLTIWSPYPGCGPYFPCDYPSTPSPVTIIIISPNTIEGDEKMWKRRCWLTGGQVYCANSTDPASEQVADIVDKQRGCVKTLYVSGHGNQKGVSFGNGDYFGCDMNTINASRIAKNLCSDATVNLCSCGSGANQPNLQNLANMLGAKTCACNSSVTKTCKCKGDWFCEEPKCKTK